jgi:hypothetical protein
LPARGRFDAQQILARDQHARRHRQICDHVVLVAYEFTKRLAI